MLEATIVRQLAAGEGFEAGMVVALLLVNVAMASFKKGARMRRWHFFTSALHRGHVSGVAVGGRRA